MKKALKDKSYYNINRFNKVLTKNQAKLLLNLLATFKWKYTTLIQSGYYASMCLIDHRKHIKITHSLENVINYLKVCLRKKYNVSNVFSTSFIDSIRTFIHLFYKLYYSEYSLKDARKIANIQSIISTKISEIALCIIKIISECPDFHTNSLVLHDYYSVNFYNL